MGVKLAYHHQSLAMRGGVTATSSARAVTWLRELVDDAEAGEEATITPNPTATAITPATRRRNERATLSPFWQIRMGIARDLRG